MDSLFIWNYHLLDQTSFVFVIINRQRRSYLYKSQIQFSDPLNIISSFQRHLDYFREVNIKYCTKALYTVILETRLWSLITSPALLPPSFPLCQQPNQHCCIFQNRTRGAARLKRSVQKLYNLLLGWQGVISVIQLSYLGLWYTSKYILSQSLQHVLGIMAMEGWLSILQQGPHTLTCRPHSQTHCQSW